MTREEAIKILETARKMYPGESVIRDAFTLALSALRPVRREQVERVWPGCKMCKTPSIAPPVGFYCPWCGTPRTAEELNDGKGD